MSRRAKFAFISWIGSDVNPLKRAKVSIEKGLVKEIVTVIQFDFMFQFKNQMKKSF